MKKKTYFLNMQNNPLTGGGEGLSSKLKRYPHLKDHYRFYFLLIFLETVAR